MESFRCTNCNFSFKAQKKDRCPYCGKIDKVEKERSAEDLINESINFE